MERYKIDPIFVQLPNDIAHFKLYMAYKLLLLITQTHPNSIFKLFLCKKLQLYKLIFKVTTQKTCSKSLYCYLIQIHTIVNLCNDIVLYYSLVKI